MRDVSGEDYSRLGEVAGRIAAYLSNGGFEAIDTPLLEETELFARKSGGEIASQLYTFTDPGGRRVSLRPEFTSSVIRHFIQEMDSPPLPVHLQYGGPVFRYEPEGENAYRQFTQVGAEVIGYGGVEADAELLKLAWQALQEAGLRDFTLRVGDIGAIRTLLDGYGLSDAATHFVIGNVAALKDGHATIDDMMSRAREVGLLRELENPSVLESLDATGGDESRDLVQELLAGAVSSPIGRRTSEQIVERLLRKMRTADDPGKLKGALELVNDLAGIEGTPGSALKAAKEAASAHGLEASLLDGLGEMLALLDRSGVRGSGVTVDLGLARGISYYTGVIFEFFYPSLAGGLLLGGGGRYDGLVKAHGGENIPALGFAFTLENVVRAVEYVSGRAGDTPGEALAAKSTDASPRRP